MNLLPNETVALKSPLYLGDLLLLQKGGGTALLSIKSCFYWEVRPRPKFDVGSL